MDYKHSAENLIGLTFYGRAPAGRQHLQIKPGVTAIYGKNGVGKSRLLQDLEKMLQYRNEKWGEYSRGDHEAPNHTTAPQPTQAMYMDGFYVREKFHDRYGFAQWSTIDLDRLLGESPIIPKESAFKVIGDLLPAEAPPEAAEYLLKHGVFWICDGGSLAYICDPDPMSGPLANMWRESQDAWRAGLRQKTPDDDAKDEEAVAFDYPSPGIDFPGNWRFDVETRWAAMHGPHAAALPKLPPLPSTLGLAWPTGQSGPPRQSRSQEGSTPERSTPTASETLT